MELMEVGAVHAPRNKQKKLGKSEEKIGKVFTNLSTNFYQANLPTLPTLGNEVNEIYGNRGAVFGLQKGAGRA